MDAEVEVEVGSRSVIMVEVDQGGEREGGGGLTVDTVRILRLVLWPVQCQRRQLYSSSNVHNSSSSSSRELEGMIVSSSSNWQTVCPAHCPSLRVGRPRELEEPLDLQEAQIRQLPGTHMEWLTAVPR